MLYFRITILCTMLCFVAMPLKAQRISLPKDSSENALDIVGGLPGVEVQLPRAKKLPAYPGGTKEWQAYLRKQIDIKVPFFNGVKPGVYKTRIRFIVGNDGKVRGVAAESNCGYGMEAEVMKAIEKSIKWNPAETVSGLKVAIAMRQFVTFTITSNDIKISF